MGAGGCEGEGGATDATKPPRDQRGPRSTTGSGGPWSCLKSARNSARTSSAIPASALAHSASFCFSPGPGDRHSGPVGDQPPPLLCSPETVAVAGDERDQWSATLVAGERDHVGLGSRNVAAYVDHRVGGEVCARRLEQQLPRFGPQRRGDGTAEHAAERLSALRTRWRPAGVRRPRRRSRPGGARCGRR
jgi:hypothetical protein